ncbi:hypothetical protein KL86CLO1_12962 [uncultured Eubacteriales bacterium]|uniref:Uncharacterized protein n=1 Tax=uncultured Eubacteriales bacterium TaxID=172733 RepID=A0A212KFP2_9FIRM|nr:hypothetical protein KL86CLO1_12962 [uncultured Eubacteriales bacterium]
MPEEKQDVDDLIFPGEIVQPVSDR